MHSPDSTGSRTGHVSGGVPASNPPHRSGAASRRARRARSRGTARRRRPPSAPGRSRGAKARRRWSEPMASSFARGSGALDSPASFAGGAAAGGVRGGGRLARAARSGPLIAGPLIAPSPAREREGTRDVLVRLRVLEDVVRQRPDRGPVTGERVDVVDASARVPVADHALRACVQGPGGRDGDGGHDPGEGSENGKTAEHEHLEACPVRCRAKRLWRSPALRGAGRPAVPAGLGATAQVADAARGEEEQGKPSQHEERDRQGRRT